MAGKNRLRLNLLGVVSILIGIVAFVATKIPVLGYGPLTIAGVAIAVGVLGFLLAILSGNYGSGLTVLGIIIGLAAAVLVEYEDGTLPGWWAKFHPKPTPAVVTPAVPSPANPATPAGPDRPHYQSIFDEPGTHTGNSNPAPSPAPPVNVPPATPTIMAQHPAPVIPQAPTITVQQAQAKVAAARSALERTLANDPQYAQAKKDVTDAEAARKTALDADGAGSPAVLQADNQWLSAKSSLRKIIDAAEAKDPASIAAQRDLKEAQAGLRAPR